MKTVEKVFLLITLSTLLVHSSEGIPSGAVENIKEFLDKQQNKLEALTEVFRQQNESQQLQIEKQQQQIENQQQQIGKQQQQIERQQEQINAQQHTTLSLLHVLLNGNLPTAESLEKEEEKEVDKFLDQLCIFGVRGVSGKDGKNGKDGRDGRDGGDGKDGDDGANGRDGRDGLPGSPGLTGPTGVPGSKGAKGDSGSPGVPGLPGVNGAQGVSGIPGKNGNPGAKGATGAAGPIGIKGAPGMKGVKGAPGNVAHVERGAVYVRWGRKSCGSQSTLLYAGFAGGEYYKSTGGGVNYQCMPPDPQYNKAYTGGSFEGSEMTGSEYQTNQFGIFPNLAYQQNVPCARCYTENRPALMMIPAKRWCPSGWTKEYEGYLMTERSSHPHPATYECVDQYPEYITGLSANANGALFYFVRIDCSGEGTTGHCPPYEYMKQLTCVVCSK